MKINEKAFHNELGWGTITEIVRVGGNTSLWMDFGYLRECIPAGLLHPAPGSPAFSAEVAPEPPASLQPLQPAAEGTNHGNTEARKGIHALRLGQVLESQILELTVGTAALDGTLKGAIERAVRGTPALLIFEGCWGGGKTHALTMLQALARRWGFTTSSAVMDGVSVSLSDPNGLMEEIISSLRFPSSGVPEGLSSILMQAYDKEALYNLRLRGARLLADLFDGVPEKALEDPEVLQLLEDYCALAISASSLRAKLRSMGYYPGDIPTLRSPRVDERPSLFVCLLMNWALFSVAMGAKGLLVVLDELDVDYASTSYGDKESQRRKGRRTILLEALRKLCRGGAPLILAFASASAGEGVDTADDAVESLRSALGNIATLVKVPAPSDDDYERLFNRLVALYRTAYGIPAGEWGQDRLADVFSLIRKRHLRDFNPVPRRFVRISLEALDLLAPGSGSTREEVMALLGA